MGKLNKWTVGLGILFVGIAFFATGASGVVSGVQIGIGVFLGLVAALVFVKG